MGDRQAIGRARFGDGVAGADHAHELDAVQRNPVRPGDDRFDQVLAQFGRETGRSSRISARSSGSR